MQATRTCCSRAVSASVSPKGYTAALRPTSIDCTACPRSGRSFSVKNHPTHHHRESQHQQRQSGEISVSSELKEANGSRCWALLYARSSTELSSVRRNYRSRFACRTEALSVVGLCWRICRCELDCGSCFLRSCHSGKDDIAIQLIRWSRREASLSSRGRRKDRRSEHGKGQRDQAIIHASIIFA